jgi:lipopolysaccharide biosynthesis regulator YciM
MNGYRDNHPTNDLITRLSRAQQAIGTDWTAAFSVEIINTLQDAMTQLATMRGDIAWLRLRFHDAQRISAILNSTRVEGALEGTKEALMQLQRLLNPPGHRDSDQA